MALFRMHLFDRRSASERASVQARNFLFAQRCACAVRIKKRAATRDANSPRALPSQVVARPARMLASSHTSSAQEEQHGTRQGPTLMRGYRGLIIGTYIPPTLRLRHGGPRHAAEGEGARGSGGASDGDTEDARTLDAADKGAGGSGEEAGVVEQRPVWVPEGTPRWVRSRNPKP